MSDQTPDPTTIQPANAGGVAVAEQKPRDPKIWVLLAIVLVLGGALLFRSCFSDEDPEAVEATAADDAAALAAQTACFEAGYFYDDEGNCYTADPVGMTPDELAAALVLLPSDDASDEAAAPDQPVAPGAAQPVAPGGAAQPAAPGGAAAPAAPSGGGAAPAPKPATPAPAPAPDPDPAPAPAPPPAPAKTVTVERAQGNTGVSSWTMKTTFPDPSDPSKTNGDTWIVGFKIVDGTVSGSVKDSQKEVTFNMSGSVAPNGAFSNFKGIATNEASKGSFVFPSATLEVSQGTEYPCDEPTIKHRDRCTRITGTYKRMFGQEVTQEGTFVMTRQV